jgi:DNA-binding NarL/FixJ family response regulator
MTTIRVLLVDDHPVVRAGYRRLLEQHADLSVVGEAGDVDGAFARFGETQPDVTVADLSLPRRSGLELIRMICSGNEAARVLVFSMHDGAALVRRVFDLGALGFLSKSAAPEHLPEAVRTVHRGQRYVSSDIRPQLIDGRTSLEAIRLASLPPRSSRFSDARRGSVGSGMRRGPRPDCEDISNYQTLIKEKLGVSTSAALVHLALRHCVISGATHEPSAGVLSGRRSGIFPWKHPRAAC